MKERKQTRKGKALAAAGAVVALTYFFDPQMGRTRRAKARDRAAAMIRRVARRVGRSSRLARGKGYGAWMRLAHREAAFKDLDDTTLVHKVESEVLGARGGESITINAEDGVIVLRGEVESAERMAELARDVLRVPGVVGVESMLHLPGEPAPNKAQALGASARAAESSSR
jgi:hypothetical protein